ncbi:MAG: LD-carboxypeptidase [Gammaproteobacteria bacterium]|jgi:muramoyltetrapeptide carboxypeptidase|nr:LD-carboxypeptidase [Gammaproteobacteria bacterium]
MNSSIELNYLKPGDIVDIVAPSSKCNPKILDKIKILLRSWELQCHIPVDLFGESLLYANSDENRFIHLKRALLNDTSKAVWCLLGGFGSTKLIPLLSKIKPPNHSKLFIGFSDITALHIFLQGKWRWATIHGPSGYQVSLNKISKNSINLLKNMLFQSEKRLLYREIIPLNKLAENNITINSALIGGNLHLLQASLGTSWQINAFNKILLIEETNERAYRIDRVLAQLSQAGIFNQAKALLFGDLIDKGEPDGRFLIKETIQQFASQISLPVLQISNIGHGSINNPILLGHNAKLSMGNDYFLEFIL